MKRIYIWKNVEKCSSNYHEDGAVVVVASSEQEARELANKKEDCHIEETEIPDIHYDLKSEDVVNEVWIFPDAGCC